MFGYDIEFAVADSATPFLQHVAMSLHNERVNRSAGRAGAKLLREHLLAKDRAEPNAAGGKRTHFYAKAARSAHYVAYIGEVLVGLNHTGIAQRYHGGRIYPSGRISSITGKPITNLAIPNPKVPEAHGTKPDDYDNLELIYNGRANFRALVERQSDEVRFRRNKKGEMRAVKIRDRKQLGGRIMFWLASYVTQQADPTVLPEPGHVRDVVAGAVNTDLQKVMKDG